MTTVTVTLESPVTYQEKTYASLTLRKMRVEDMLAGDLVKGETRKAIAIIASMAGVPLGVVETLDIDDFETLSDKAAPLMGKSMARAAAEAEAKTAETPA